MGKLSGWHVFIKVIQVYLFANILELGFGRAYSELYEVSYTKCCTRYVYNIMCDGIRVTVAVIGEGGMLIHCVSGWDRTPLFVSLLRLSLWAVSQAVWLTAVDFFMHVRML